MRTTSSFEIFPNDASERDLAKARWFRREGRLREAEAAYRAVIGRQPGLRSSWTECFDLLRKSGQADAAFALAADAERAFGTEAFPLALKGAALIEKKQFRQALETLEHAVVVDPHLALTWHELGYAAYRLGDGSRAMLALDRAFALEPHTETLILRGRILREAGEYYAATVAFEGAMHSASHDEQRAQIEHEIEVTQRLGDFAPRRPRDLTAAEQWFAEHGTIVLAATAGATGPTSDDLARAFVDLAGDRDWQFGQFLAVERSPSAVAVAEALGLDIESPRDVDPSRNPVLFADRVGAGTREWDAARQRLRDATRGVAVVLWQAETDPPQADIVGALERDGEPLTLGVDPADAIVMAQHPKAATARRELAERVSPA